MIPKEYFTLSSITSVAGAAGIVLVVTNFVAMIYEWCKGQYAVQFRLIVGVIIAAIIAGLAMLVSPPSPGGWGAVYASPWGLSEIVFVGFANTCLLFVTAFGGSKLSAAGAGQDGNQAFLRERNRLAVYQETDQQKRDIKNMARFWRPW